jgi:hypothetical protein
MPLKQSKKIVRIVVAVILLLLLTQNACVHASWVSHRIRREMTVNDVLQISGGWDWRTAYSERPVPEPGLSLSFNSHSAHLPGKDESQEFASPEELA